MGVTHAAPFAIETDAVSSSYASSLMYDDSTDRLYLTGSTYGGSASFFHVDGVDVEDGSAAPQPVAAAKLDENENTEDDYALMSDCFLGILQVPRQDHAPEWLRRVAIGVPDQSESCSDLFTYRHGNNRKLLLTGHVIGGTSVLQEQHELFSSTTPNQSSSGSSNNATVNGMVLDLTWYAELRGGYLLDQSAVQYPVVVVANDGGSSSDNDDDEEVYVASLQSTVDAINPAFVLYQESEVDDDLEDLDLTTAGGYLPPAFGNQYSLLLQRLGRREPTESELFSVSSENAVNANATQEESTSASLLALRAAFGVAKTSAPSEAEQAQSYDEYRYVTEPLQQQWGREFVADQTSVQVSSLLHRNSDNGNVLIVAGSTRGSGFGLGESTDFSMSGFITIVDATLGMVLRNRRVSSVSPGSTSDHILGLCQDKENHLYAVGMTNGEMNNAQQSSQGPRSESIFQAFLQKINAETLNVIWTRTLAAETDGTHPGSVHGMSCAVTPDGSHVYLAGTVKDGAAILTQNGSTTTTAIRSSGHDDLFVAQYKANDGAVRFVKQLGTQHNDRLAAGQGVVCDKFGDAILLGNTQGSFLNPADKTNTFVNDVIVISIDRTNGDHVDLTQNDEQPKTIPTVPENEDGDSLYDPRFGGMAGSSQQDKDSESDMFPLYLGLFVVAVAMTLGTLSVYIWRRRRSRESDIVARYLLSPINKDGLFTMIQKSNDNDYDPECATTPIKTDILDDIASTDIGEEENYYYQEDVASFSTADSMMLPLSTPADEIDSRSYKKSLLRLEQIERDEPPEPPRIIDKEKTKKQRSSETSICSREDEEDDDNDEDNDTSSLLPQESDDLLERWLNSDIVRT